MTTMWASEQRSLRRQIKRIDAELKVLRKERQQIESRGCYSDKELAAKDGQLADYDRRIQVLDLERSRLQLHPTAGGARE
jgi:chromosome segregation ATPase